MPATKRILLENILDPLIIEKPRAIDEIMKPAHWHRRLRFETGLGLKRSVAHCRRRGDLQRQA